MTNIESPLLLVLCNTCTEHYTNDRHKKINCFFSFNLRMSSSAAILSRVKEHCSARGISIKDEFLSLDRKKLGFIPSDLFRRFFVSIRFSIGDQQFNNLAAKYKREEGLIDVIKFITDVQNSAKFTNLQKVDTSEIYSELFRLRAYLEANNITMREIFKSYDKSFRGYVTQKAFFGEFGCSPSIRKIAEKYTFDQTAGVFYSAIEKDLNNLQDQNSSEKPDLTNVADAILFKGFDVNRSFQQYDRYRTGRLSPENFASVLRDFCPDKVTEITKYYQDCDGLCDTRRFCKDVMNQTQTIKSQPKPQKTPPPPPDPEEVMRFFKGAIYQRRIRIQDVFPQNTTSLPYSIFYNIVEGLGLGLTREDIDSIANYFKSGAEIDISKFFEYFVPAPPKLSEVPVPEIRDYLKRTHQRLEPYCARVDRQKTGEINAFELHTILNRLGLSISKIELDAIARVFKGSAPQSVKYQQLCMAVDPTLEYTDSQKLYFQQEEEKEKQERALARQRAVPFQESIIPILQKINYYAELKSVMVYDEIKEIDRLRCGFINEQQLYDALSFAELSPEERKLLWDAYPDGKYSFLVQDLKDPRSAPIKRVKHELNDKLTHVLSELKGVLHARSLSIYDVIGERNTLATRAAAQLSRYTSQSSLIVDTFRDKKRPELVDSIGLYHALQEVPILKKQIYRDNEDAYLRDLVAIRQKLDARHKNINNLFNGCPQYISYDELIQRIQSANIIIEGREGERLQRKFDSPQGVDWKNFVSEVQSATTFAPVE